MQAITLEINNELALNALRDLETQKVISILAISNFDSPSFPGEPISISQFKTWISDSEQSSLIPFNEVKEKWAQKRKQLQDLIR